MPHDPLWRFYLSPATAWDAMYEDCTSAQKFIQLEQYILENDPVGQKFLHLFIQKAKQGVRVNILCDMVGSHGLINSPLADELRKSGGVLRFYDDFTFIDWLRLRRWMPRTHAKMLVVDMATAYIGGVCWAERMKDWRDTQMRVTGEVVQHIQHALEHNMQGGRIYRAMPPAPDFEFTYMQSEPWIFQHKIYKMLLQAIRLAKVSIYISAAFFIPTRRFRRLLGQASSRGVKVIILIPEHSDFWLADWVCLSYAARLLKSGVRIFGNYHLDIVQHNC